MNPIITNEMLHKHMVKMAKLDERIFSPLYCKVCNFIGKSSEDSTAHLKSRDHAERVSILASRKTFVFWDINSCPVPDDLDAGLVVPSIKRLLEKSGFSGGPLTITAVGDLERIWKQTPDVLPAISSTGVLLKHGREGLAQLSKWTTENPPPATIMLICSRGIAEYYPGYTDILRAKGYTIFFYPFLECILREQCSEMYMQPPAFWCETGESAWCCILCGINITHKLYGAKGLLGESFHGESIEDLTKHLESRGHKWIELDTVGTQVWWDINSCPVPDDLDASLVVPSIKGLLEKSGFPGGLLTITAFGDLEATLKQTPDVLPAISSTGVLLKHVPRALDLWNELVSWILDDLNPPPTDIVLISSRLNTDSSCILFLQDREYTISLYPALIKPCSEMNWQPSTAWCSETVESAWCCMLCRHHTRKLFRIGESIEDFTKHLESKCHNWSLESSELLNINKLSKASKKKSIEDEDAECVTE